MHPSNFHIASLQLWKICTFIGISKSEQESHDGTADWMMFFGFLSATKALQDAVETAEKVGLAALIIQVSLSCLRKGLHCLWEVTDRDEEPCLCDINYCSRISGAFCHLITSLAGIELSKVGEIQVCSCSTPMPDSIGKRSISAQHTLMWILILLTCCFAK